MRESAVLNHQLLGGQALRVPGEGEVELCTDEESLLSLVSGAQDGAQEMRFMVIQV